VFDVVTARALAPLDRLLGWAMPLVAPGGELLAMKGSSAGEEIAAAGPVLRRLGCGEPRQVAVSGTTVVRVPGGSSAQRRDLGRSGSKKKGK
jgi:16S rRNA (guanine527-N7)-methyltransferase